MVSNVGETVGDRVLKLVSCLSVDGSNGDASEPRESLIEKMRRADGFCPSGSSFDNWDNAWLIRNSIASLLEPPCRSQDLAKTAKPMRFVSRPRRSNVHLQTVTFPSAPVGLVGWLTGGVHIFRAVGYRHVFLPPPIS